MVGASSFRKAATKIKFPCVSFSRRQLKDDDAVVVVVFDNNISSSSSLAMKKRENASKILEEKKSSKSLCAICLEPLSYSTTVGSPEQAIFTAQCSHAFHFSCISSNVRHGSVTCPICRAHWTQLPRSNLNLNLHPHHHHHHHPTNTTPPPLPSCITTTQSDPILRILDDSIATFRVHRRYSLRSARYDDDDPVEPDLTQTHPRLHFSLLQLTSNNNNRASSSSSSSSYLSVTLAHHEPTDLVLVASPNGPHLRLLKQSIALVVFSLRSVDRLAIVTYSSAATRAFPLRRMTSHGKRTALQVIDRLFYMGEADPSEEGLKKGIKILDDRAHKNPRSCILHLSDSPTRPSYLQVPVAPPVHRFHVGFGFGTSSNGFVMHEFEEFLARLLGGVIRETQLRIGEDGGVVRLGELRGGEERRIAMDLGDSEFICVGYSYMEGVDECIRSGEIVVGVEDKRENSSHGGQGQGQASSGGGGREVSIGGRTSVEGWDYHDPYMARRWAKHLHGYRL